MRAIAAAPSALTALTTPNARVRGFVASSSPGASRRLLLASKVVTLSSASASPATAAPFGLPRPIRRRSGGGGGGGKSRHLRPAAAAKAAAMSSSTTPASGVSSGLVLVNLGDPAAPWRSLVAAAAARCLDAGGAGNGAELRVFFFHGCAAGDATPRTLDLLTRCYDTIAFTAPTLNLIPLLQNLGWNADAVARAVPDATHLFAVAGAPPSTSTSSTHASSSEEAAVVVEAIQRARAAHNLPPLTTVKISIPSSSSSKEKEKEEDKEEEEDEGCGKAGSSSLRFSKVSVGGTFDRMHAGHRLLLAAASAVTAPAPLTATATGADADADADAVDAAKVADAVPTIYVGVTGDALLVSKKHRDLIQPYESRVAAAASFLTATRPPHPPPAVYTDADRLDGGDASRSASATFQLPGVRIRVGPLDHSAPLAATVEEMEALVISRETVEGGEALNEMRAASGFAPVALAVVGLVGERRGGGGGGGGADGVSGTGTGGMEKLSSSALRQAEAAEKTQRDE